MRDWFERFLTAMSTSIDLQIRVCAIFIVPTVILLFGASQMGGTPAAGPHADIVAAASEVATRIYFVSALMSAVWCITVASKEYRRVHKRLFGY